jgi:Putative prokaryotic signal transducing protein
MEFRDLVSVYTLTDPVKAEIIRNALQAEGIHCVLDGINMAEQLSLSPFPIRVLVPAADADRAAHLIESHESRRHGHHQ